jgi:hypothetical protein
MSNIYNETIIVLGSLRYQSAPDTDLGLKVPFVQSTKIGIEFDRSADVNLQQVYDDERQDVAIVDITNAFIQTRVEEKKDRVIIRIRGVVVDWLTKIAPKVYTKYVSKDRKGDKTLLVECMNAIYGTMIAGLLYYRKFAECLERKNFIKNS